MNHQKLTMEELNQFNGRNGAPAYIAFKGTIYDVSYSYHWQNGQHWVMHFAGRDLTREMDDAPHGAELLETFPVVGILI